MRARVCFKMKSGVVGRCSRLQQPIYVPLSSFDRLIVDSGVNIAAL